MTVVKETRFPVSAGHPLVTATASCVAVTSAAAAVRRNAPPIETAVGATGQKSREQTRTAARTAESRCPISRALDVPADGAVAFEAVPTEEVAP